MITHALRQFLRAAQRAAQSAAQSAANVLCTGLALVAGVALAGALSTSAHAQFGGQSSFAEAFQPDFLPRDMVTFNEVLGLEDWQRPIVEMLMEDYNDSFRAGVDGVRDEMTGVADRLQGASQADVMDLVMGPVRTWMAEKRRLADSFLSNVRGQLSDAQRANWPALERALRRDKQLPRGQLSGESVNLITILRSMPLDAETRTAIQPAIDRYAIRLDEALVARENVLQAVEQQLADAMRTMDFNAGMAATDQIMAARIAVRNAQDQSAIDIEQALPSSYRADFRNRHQMAGYSKVYRSGGQMDRFFETIRAISDLRQDQIASIDVIENGYWEQIDSINDQMVSALRTEEPAEARRRTEMIKARHEGLPVPAREATRSSQLMVERDAIADQTRKQIMALLTAEQIAELPSHAKTRVTGGEADPRRGDAAPVGSSRPPQRNADSDAERRDRARQPEQDSGRDSGGSPKRDGRRLD